jgi:hypothetical protein
MPLLAMSMLVLGTTIWIAVDASGRDWSSNRFCNATWKWVVGALLLWVVTFPLYLVQRGRVPGSLRKRSGIKVMLGVSASLALAVSLVVVFVVRPALASVDKGAYVRHNEALFRTIPVFRGSRFLGADSSAVKDFQRGFTENGGPYGAYVTTHLYESPAAATCPEIASFYARTLTESGWRAAELRGPAQWTYRRDAATLLLMCSAPLASRHGSWDLSLDYSNQNYR